MVHLHARQTVVPDNACVAPPRPFGAHRRKPSVLGTREPKIEKQTSLTDNELCTHRARPGPHAPWALAWSFTDARLPDVSQVEARSQRGLPASTTCFSRSPVLCILQDVARPSAAALHRILPPRTTFHQPPDQAPPASALQQVLGALAGESKSESEATTVVVAPDAEDGDSCRTYVVVTRRDTWSRAARRKKAQQLCTPDPRPRARTGTVEREEGRAALVAHVWVEKECMGKSGVQLVVQWKRGHDAQLFESFASHVARKTHEVVVSGLGSAH